MYRLINLLIVILFLTACNNVNSNNEDVAKDKTEPKEEVTKEPELKNPQDNDPLNKQDPVKGDLEQYIDQLVPVLQLEIQAVQAYSSVTGLNYTSDHAVYEALTQTIIPIYQEFNRRLEAIRVETDEVRVVHEKYIEAANLQYNAFVRIVSAVRTQDITKVEESNLMMEETRSMIRDVAFELNQLMEKHDIQKPMPNNLIEEPQNENIEGEIL